MNSSSGAEAAPAVLIVNDDAQALLALAAALEGGPWRVVTALSGVGAFKQLLIEDSAVIVLDVIMPGGLNGFEVAEMVRARPRHATTPIIFCSATARADADLFKGYELGAVDYLLSPISPRALRSKVAVFVELYEQKRRLARTVAELRQAQAELEQHNRELRRWQTRDPLTGCLSPAGFVLCAAPLFDAARAGGELAIVAIDLDCAAQTDENDTDRSVRRISRLVTAGLRDGDELTRWRDGQFVVALAGTSLDEAVQIAQRLRDRISSAERWQGNRGQSSFGVASTALGAATLEELVAQAEAAARSAREVGTGTICRAGPPADHAAQ